MLEGLFDADRWSTTFQNMGPFWEGFGVTLQVVVVEAVVPFFSFFSYRSFCHNRMSPFDIRQSELMKCFVRVSIS